ncbi:MAG TPA: 7,8-didemethyl-8-hydroxy-5-deazariboflavin synthase CofG, partial [Candidatus Nitrosocosmicus sp.]|nr:7,8-didemethyl-8-hydroxy-5-deazariboflavin synthase CofG [Candidatus Nitrosocosmicus sp.]
MNYDNLDNYNYSRFHNKAMPDELENKMLEIPFQDVNFRQEILEGRYISHNKLRMYLESAQLGELISLSKSIRDKTFGNRITYSRKVFINLVNLCKDSCSYCTYKKEPNELKAVMLQPSEAIAIAEAGRKAGCTEALIVTGERPETKYPEAKKWLHDLGFTNLTELISDLSEKILDKTGLLPHTNAGSLVKKEMSMLKSTNVSLGMMLENTSERLFDLGQAHANAPSKIPKVRLRSLISAGELKIPITTGLLIGIGERFDEVVDSLLLIKELNTKYGHIQEVIIQNFLPKIGTSMEYASSPTFSYFLRCLSSARIILGDISIQVPPNLSPNIYSKYLYAGIDDWGGISPLTPDFVNPECPWPRITEISNITRHNGHTLRARLPLYPKYIFNQNLSTKFIHPNLKGYIEPLVDNYG